MKWRNPGRTNVASAHRLITACGLLLLVGLTAALLNGAAMQAQDDSDYADSPPRQCRVCHADIYREWRDSHHALSFSSAEFQRVWERSRQNPDCLTCHSPAFDVETGEMGYEGVGCAACHRTLDPTRRRGSGFTYHGRMSTQPSAADCGSCHGADHALTFVEWQSSAHNGARAVDCLGCHLPHAGGITAASGEELCGSCHLQDVPTVNPHMHVEGGCTDCHPAPVNMDNVHMHEGANIDCIACHVVTEPDQYGRYLKRAGHLMDVSLAACLNCHGSLHDPQAAE